MSETRLERTAEILLKYSTELQPDEWVFVSAHLAARPLVEEVCRQAWAASAKVSLVWEDDELNEALLSNASEEVLGWLPPEEQFLFEKANVILYLHAAENTRSLSAVPPERLALHQRSRGVLRQIRNRRVQNEGLRWVYTQYPSQALAQEAGMSLHAYQDFAFGAIHADQADPLRCWQEMERKQQHWVDELADHREVILKGADIDMRLSITGRTFINACGKNNLPDGEIFTGPVENSVNGWVRFSFPAIFNGRAVEGVELHFTDGQVTSAKADRDEAFLLSMLETDTGSRFLGEFAIGTNHAIRNFTRNILFDEKMGGTIHLALGNGYPETGSLNRSLIHWDLICDMRQDGEIRVDSDLLFRNGEFQV
jgi:aminopeptidase